jgi:phosphotransferase system  glucose/maltose/N-acetylglucosamine-specific IIC component
MLLAILFPVSFAKRHGIAAYLAAPTFFKIVEALQISENII